MKTWFHKYPVLNVFNRDEVQGLFLCQHCFNTEENMAQLFIFLEYGKMFYKEYSI